MNINFDFHYTVIKNLTEEGENGDLRSIISSFLSLINEEMLMNQFLISKKN